MKMYVYLYICAMKDCISLYIHVSMPVCECMYMCEWVILCMSLNISACTCMCVRVCAYVLLDACSVLFCSCTGTPEASALMEAEAVVSVLIAQTCRLLL